MTQQEFEALIGTNTLVDYDFNGENQVWNLQHFRKLKKPVQDSYGITRIYKHDYLPVIAEVMYPKFVNPRPANNETTSNGGA